MYPGVLVKNNNFRKNDALKVTAENNYSSRLYKRYESSKHPCRELLQVISLENWLSK
jgi:hypothetical protein